MAPANKALIERFLTERRAGRGLTESRVRKLRWHLIREAGWLGKDFRKATKADIVRLVGLIDSEGYKDWTRRDFLMVLKLFYKWLFGKDELYPEQVRWIRSRKGTNTLLPQQLLGEEEIIALVNHASHPRDKALIFCLYDSGVRIGELLSMRIGNVSFEDGKGAVIQVRGKTGDRRIRIIASSALLAAWLDQHPMRDDPAAPVWICWGKSNANAPMDYGTVSTMLRRVAKRAGLKKPVNPHHFRHSRASFLAKFLTESQLKQYFGWKQGSAMPQTYVHLSGRDVDDPILKLNGLEEEQHTESKLKPRNCYRCRMANSATSHYCTKCGAILDLTLAQELVETRAVSRHALRDGPLGVEQRLAHLEERLALMARAKA